MLRPTSRGAANARYGRTTIDRALRSGELVLVRRGVVAGASCTSGLAFDVAVQQARVRGRCVASHGTAAALFGVERLGKSPAKIRLTKPDGGAWQDQEVSVGVAQLPATHCCVVRDVQATSLARTVVDMSRRASFTSGVVLADSALRLGCPRDELDAVLRDCHEWPGSPQAEAAVAFASQLAESVMESVSRAVFARHGLPAPELQARLSDSEGLIGRVDFLWRAERVIGEADGLGKYRDILDLHAEKLRQERLERAGFVVVRWTWDDVWLHASRTVERIRRALTRSQA